MDKNKVNQKQTMNSSLELKNLFEAMAKAQGEMPPVTKSQSASKYKYAPLEDIQKATRPVLSKNGIAVFQFVQTKDQDEYLITRITHSSGEWIESEIRMIITPLAFAKGEINQQSVGSAISYYKRYAYVSSLGVIVEGEDDDAQAAIQDVPKKVIDESKPLTKQTGEELVKLLAAIENDEERQAKITQILRYNKVATLGELTEQQALNAIKHSFKK